MRAERVLPFHSEHKVAEDDQHFRAAIELPPGFLIPAQTPRNLPVEINHEAQQEPQYSESKVGQPEAQHQEAGKTQLQVGIKDWQRSRLEVGS